MKKQKDYELVAVSHIEGEYSFRITGWFRYLIAETPNRAFLVKAGLTQCFSSPSDNRLKSRLDGRGGLPEQRWVPLQCPRSTETIC